MTDTPKPIKFSFARHAPAETGKIITGPATFARQDRAIGTRAVNALVDEQTRREKGTFIADTSLLNFSQNSRDEVDLDNAQLRAVTMCMTERFGIIGGYAGTGKTTTMQKVVQSVAPTLRNIDWKHFRSGGAERGGPEHQRPAIAMCCTTNMAARNLASKLPEEWANHCMSIHSLLAFAPEASGEFSATTGREIIRFMPRYTETNRMPIQVLFIDEAGQVPVELWQMILDAAQPDLRIYFLGDLAQLPPIYGHSPMVFALPKWPHVILDKIYRQKDGSALLDGITAIRRGLNPQHDPKTFRCGEQETLDPRPSKAANHIAGYVGLLFSKGLFDPMQDIIITAENDADLGQANWNRAFQFHFNPEKKDGFGRVVNPPVNITTALGVARFRVGDKVMSTSNGGRRATERRFVNGSLGVVVKIAPNPGYRGNFADTMMPDNDMMQLDLTDLGDTSDMAPDEETVNELLAQQALENDDNIARRAASHIITVKELVTGETFDLTTSAEIQDLQFGYATTCNRFQGSQARNVLVICHENMSYGLNREWLYTACSRAKERVFLLHTKSALNRALQRQQLPGANPVEKAELLITAYAKKPWGRPIIPAPEKI